MVIETYLTVRKKIGCILTEENWMLSSPGFNNRLMPLIILPLLQPRKSQYWQISLRVPCEQKILAFTYFLLPQSMQEVCFLPCAFSQELHRIYDTCFFVSCDSTCMTCDTECTSASVCYGDIRTRIWHFHIHGSNFPVCHACRPSWSVPCHQNWHTDFSECRHLINTSFFPPHSLLCCLPCTHWYEFWISGPIPTPWWWWLLLLL